MYEEVPCFLKNALPRMKDKDELIGLTLLVVIYEVKVASLCDKGGHMQKRKTRCLMEKGMRFNKLIIAGVRDKAHSDSRKRK